jgi:hypothetical protein
LLGTGHYRTQMTAAVGSGAAVRKRPTLWRKARA